MSLDPELIAVLDVGKTHARLLLIERNSGSLCWSQQRECTSLGGGAFRELDVGGTESWLMQSLAEAPGRERIRHIVPVAHGAAAVLIDAHGQRLAALDYEEPEVETVSSAYNVRRDPFSSTYSPSLPVGLNLGRQWYFLQTRYPDMWRRVDCALLYPQYWAWALSGIASSEITSLGCHSDLWRPAPSRPSELTIDQHWQRLLPPLRGAGEVLGRVTSRVAEIAGLNPDCQVYCGIHDSNASYLSHLAAHEVSRSGTAGAVAPLCVISSGTWTVLLSQGTPLSRLVERLDMLANIDATGNPVATARFMGGRDFAQIAGGEARNVLPELQALGALIENEVRVLPGVATPQIMGSERPFVIERADKLKSPAERATLATLYIALMCDLLLDELGASGDLVVDGPLSINPLFARLLQTFRETQPVYTSHRTQGAAAAARYLVTGLAPAREVCAHQPLGQRRAALARYRSQWRELVAANRAC